MKKAGIICVGKIRNILWQKACAHYLGLLRPWRTISQIEIKDSRLPAHERRKQEAERIWGAIQHDDYTIALDEKGREFTSQGLADLLKACDEKYLKRPVFIIGGPYGLDDSILTRASCQLALSRMTFPHELARVVFLEQLYRSESILRGTPYHH